MPAQTATPAPATTTRPDSDGPHFGQTCDGAEQMLAALGSEVEELPTKRLTVVTAERDAAAASAAAYADRLNQALAANDLHA